MSTESQHMNPNFPKIRGCFIDKRNPEKVILVDYPTWSSKNGRLVIGEANAPIPDGTPFEKTFPTFKDAVEFAKSENYGICTDPWTKPKFEKVKDYSDEYDD